MAGYNPIGYHVGSGLAARQRHRRRRSAAATASATRQRASRQRCSRRPVYFRDARLPELFCGFDRERSPFPVPYPVACSPQAWASGALFQLLVAMLGLEPDAAARRARDARSDAARLAARGPAWRTCASATRSSTCWSERPMTRPASRCSAGSGDLSWSSGCERRAAGRDDRRQPGPGRERPADRVRVGEPAPRCGAAPRSRPGHQPDDAACSSRSVAPVRNRSLRSTRPSSGARQASRSPTSGA